MASEETPERLTPSPRAVVISITVTEPPPRGTGLRERLSRIVVPRRALAVVAVALALAAVGAILATALRGTEATRRAEQLPPGQVAAIAGQLGYPYPLRCLAITISPSDPDYARADVERTDACARYHGYVNASLHRVDGAWRLVLDEGQLFVPNALLSPCRSERTGRPLTAGRIAGWRAAGASC